MRFVAVKTIEQQDIQAVHRVRASLISERGAKANQLRGLAYEYGLVAPREIAAPRQAVPAATILECETDVVAAPRAGQRNASFRQPLLRER